MAIVIIFWIGTAALFVVLLGIARLAARRPHLPEDQSNESKGSESAVPEELRTGIPEQFKKREGGSDEESHAEAIRGELEHRLSRSLERMARDLDDIRARVAEVTRSSD